MKITTQHGTLTLYDNARPSVDDMDDIIGSLTRGDDNGAEFQALCDASVDFGDLTNSEFIARCEVWLRSHRTNA